MYIEKLGRNNRQINSKLLQFAAEYYGIDYLKLRMSARLTNQLDGYRAFAIKCNNLNGDKVRTLIWFADFEFGSLTDEYCNNNAYKQFMKENMLDISDEILNNYVHDYVDWINHTPMDDVDSICESDCM